MGVYVVIVINTAFEQVFLVCSFSVLIDFLFCNVTLICFAGEHACCVLGIHVP